MNALHYATPLLLAPLLFASPQAIPAFRFEAEPCTAARAEVVNIVLHDSAPAYFIPAGQVLFIDHLIWALEGDAHFQRISTTPANDIPTVGDFQLKFDTTAPDSWTPSAPIRIVGGDGAGVRIIYQAGGSDWRDVMIVGRLIDV